MSIEITGLDTLMKKLEAMPKELKKAEQKITRDMCKPIQKDAIENAPRSKPKKGQEDKEHMADNIKINSMKYDEDGIATRKVFVKGKKFFYSMFVEWGTSKVPPRPFMGKAVLNNKDKIIKIAEQSVLKILKKVEK